MSYSQPKIISSNRAFLAKLQHRQLELTVQPKNNARARSGARSSCTARTCKPLREGKIPCFCALPAKTLEVQEVESLTARSRKKLKI